VQTDTTVYHYCCHVLFNWLLFLNYSRFGQTPKKENPWGVEHDFYRLNALPIALPTAPKN